MKKLVIICLLITSFLTYAQDSWTSTLGETRENLLSAVREDSEYKIVSNENTNYLIFRKNEGMKNSKTMTFLFDKISLKCIAVAIAMDIEKHTYLTTYLTDRYPNQNAEKTIFWSANEIAEIQKSNNQVNVYFSANTPIQ